GGHGRRLLRLHARDHRQRDGQHGSAGRALRSRPEGLSRRPDGGCVLRRFHERDHHHVLSERLGLESGDRPHNTTPPARVSANVRWTPTKEMRVALMEPGEAAASYKAKILHYQAGADFLALQAAAPAKLASLVAGLSAEQLAHRP